MRGTTRAVALPMKNMNVEIESLAEIALTQIHGGAERGPVPEPVGPTGKTVFKVPGTDIYTTNPGMNRRYDLTAGAGSNSYKTLPTLHRFMGENGLR